MADWLGVESDTLATRRFRELLTLPGRVLYETNVAPALRLQGGFEEVALDLAGQGGAKLPVLVNAKVRCDGAGDVVAVRMVLVRAGDRRGYERDLLGREAAAVRGQATAQKELGEEQATSQLREQFIAVLGHDLRNPLASIVGAARILRREVQSEKALRILEMMEASVDRMAGLIDDVMDFARGRLGSGIDLHRQVDLLEPVLRHVVAELEANNPSRVFGCDLAVPDPVSFDAGRISQLVSNLLGNALAHGDPKAAIRLGAESEAGLIKIWVANAGTPIPPAAMERLFQPFFRGEVRPSQQGLGLGLHIASEIAHAHGGALTVRSDEHETRFTFAFPAR